MIASEGGGAVVEEPGSTRSTAERDVSRNPTDHHTSQPTPEGDTDMTDITTKEELARAEQALSPRQIELRDGRVPDGSGVAARRAERLLHLERELSRKQSKTYELLRLREHVKTAPDVGADIVEWNVNTINAAVERADRQCAELQAEITTLRAAR